MSVSSNTKGRNDSLRIWGRWRDIPPAVRVYRSTWQKGLVLTFSDDPDFWSDRNDDKTKDTLTVQNDPENPEVRWMVHSVVFDRVDGVRFGRTETEGYMINPFSLCILWSDLPVEVQ